MPVSRAKVVANEDWIEYVRPSGKKAWSLQISDIVLVAEYTTNDGPWLDDWFLEFVTMSSDRLYFYHCTMYVDGIYEVQDVLIRRLNAIPQLAGCTEWDSRVLWPPHLVGKPYFEFQS